MNRTSIPSCCGLAEYRRQRLGLELLRIPESQFDDLAWGPLQLMAKVFPGDWELSCLDSIKDCPCEIDGTYSYCLDAANYLGIYPKVLWFWTSAPRKSDRLNSYELAKALIQYDPSQHEPSDQL